MLNLINRYAHGFVAVPAILALQDKGLFKLLGRQGPLDADAIAAGLDANGGPLRVALRLLQSLGWLSRDTEGRYVLAATANMRRHIPPQMAELYRFPTGSPRLLEEMSQRYIDWTVLSRQGWDLDGDSQADLLDGVLLIPLLFALRGQGLLEETAQPLLAALPADVRLALLDWFQAKGWIKGVDGNPRWSEVGRHLVERMLVLGVTASYTPLLARLPQLLFGDPRAVFEHTEVEAETHLDRSLNVIASGFQHEKFFQDFDAAIQAIFDRQPYDQQPAYVADMGSGDGTLLRRIYRHIVEHTARGRVLDRYPLTMIGIDYNREALEVAAANLRAAGVPHRVVQGDVGDPQRLEQDLQALGIADCENILHVRSFLDHDRPWLQPAESERLAARRKIPYEGVFVADDGSAIPPADAIQGLYEHLERWARLSSRHGLLILEVHCLDADSAGRNLDLAESLHFDALQAFSKQQLVEAADFLLTAAEAGLFAKPEFQQRYPRTLPFCRITLNWFEQRPYRLRLADEADLPALLQLESACWAEPLRTDEDGLRQRLQRFPKGQCLLEMDGRIVAAIYSQRIATADDLARSSFAQAGALHRDDGPLLQLVTVNVLPEVQHLGLGDQLLEFMLQYAGLINGVEKVVGVTRCLNFQRDGNGDMAGYIRRRNERGQPEDPVLAFHHYHGASIEGVLPDYRPEDADNQGCGVLISYDLLHRRPGGHTTEPKAASSEEKSAAATVERCTRDVLGPRRESRFAMATTFKDMGLDSLDLLELRTQLNHAAQLQLEPVFFFRYSSPKAVAEYLDKTPSPNVGWGESANPNVRGATSDAIAVIGIGCRFPGGADDAGAYWQLLLDGRDAIGEPPPGRGNGELDEHNFPATADMPALRQGGFIDGADRFDAAFFGIAPREAQRMDPQQRLLLEVSWQALEHAGIDPRGLQGSATGVFVGLFGHDYELLQQACTDEAELDAYCSTGVAPSVAAGRLSYTLGLQGPALTLDTACSSSLVAVHLACRSLRDGECGLALAAGVNLILTPQASIAFSRAGMLSPDGRCRTFDAQANGYVRGEGCGVVVLKPLEQALADGDTVYAVVRGSAVNQDGRSNGLTAPNGQAQEAVIRKALQAASVAPGAVRYVEAHGTGTPLGDPVEVHALQAVYGENRPGDFPLVVGSAKTNIGHLEAAAGMAGLIKTALALHHGQIPRHLHYRQANPHLDLRTVPTLIPSDTLPWPRQADRPRLAGISSFGYSGTNAHVILAEAPPAAATEKPQSLPFHQFQRKRYWLPQTSPPDKGEPGGGAGSQAPLARSHRSSLGTHTQHGAVNHPLLGHRLPLSAAVAVFDSPLSQAAPSYALSHRLNGAAVLSAAVLLEMALAAARRLDTAEASGYSITGLGFDHPLHLGESAPPHIQLLMLPEQPAGTWQFRLSSGDGVASWTQHAQGRIAPSTPSVPPLDLAALQTRLTEEVPLAVFQTELHHHGLQLDDALAAMQALWHGNGESLCRIRLPQDAAREAPLYQCHPLLLDAALTSALVNLHGGSTQESVNLRGAHVLAGIDNFNWQGGCADELWCHCRLQSQQGPRRKLDLTLCDGQGRIVAQAEGCTFAVLETTAQPDVWTNWLYRLEWRPDPQPPQSRPSLPAPQTLEAALQPVTAQLGTDDAAVRLAGLQPQLEQLSFLYIAAALRTLGWNPAVGDRCTEAALAERLGVAATHRRLFRRLLEILREEEVLSLQGEALDIFHTPDGQSPQTRCEQLLAQYPQACDELRLLSRCGDHLAQVLRGDCAPLTLLFPDADPATMARLYQHAPTFAPMHRLLDEALQRLRHKHGLRILEIGAGTGGTSAWLLPHLGENCEYVFTDVSAHFFDAARQRFAAYPYLQYRKLDIEQPPPEQGFEAGRYDLVVASNVLHATRDLAATVGHARSLLAPGGQLLLVEGMAPRRWIDLIFGLLEGWWAFADHALRPSYPLLSAQRWEELLAAQGFDAVAAIAPANAETMLFPQALILARNNGPAQKQTRLIFADAQGVGERLAEQCQAQGDTCVLIRPGHDFEQISPSEYRLDPLQVDHYRRLLQDAGTGIAGIVHLWSLDLSDCHAPASVSLSLSLRERVGVRGENSRGRITADFYEPPDACTSALYLSQALLQSANPPPLRLVTQGAVAADTDQPFQAPLWGFGLVLEQEHPELHCHLLDLDPAQGITAADHLLQALNNPGTEQRSAIRNSQRYLPRLARIPSPANELAIDPNAAYLITGGLGGMGLHLAAWLVEKGARHLVLAGRSAPTEPAQRALDALTEQGVQISIHQADISRYEETAALVAAIPKLRGVIHCAGVFSDALIQNQQRSQFQQVFAAKALGAWHLHQATQGLELDLFLLCSSAFSLLPSAGLANYAAANSFLDSLAAARRRQGLPGLSVNWGPWDQVGMAGAVGERRESQWAAAGIRPMAPQSALAALDRLLASDLAQAAVMDVDWQRYLPPGETAPAYLAELATPAATPTAPAATPILQRLQTATASQRQALLRDHVASLATQILGFGPGEALDLRRGLFDQGMDSLTAMELRNKLQRDLALNLPATIAMEHPSVAALGDYLAGKLADTTPIQSHTDESPLSRERERAGERLIASAAAPAPAKTAAPNSPTSDEAAIAAELLELERLLEII